MMGKQGPSVFVFAATLQHRDMYLRRQSPISKTNI